MDRAERVVRFINEGEALEAEGAPIKVFRSSCQLKTHLKTRGAAIDRSQQEGFAHLRVGDGWVIGCLSGSALRSGPDWTEAVANWHERRARTLAKAGMNPGSHVLRGTRLDAVIADPAAAPLTIFPFDPETCARLACDVLTYETVLSWERLERALTSVGFTASFQRPEQHESSVEPGDEVFRAQLGTTVVTGRANAIHQILFELVDPQRLAEAARELIAEGGPQGSGSLVFANERATWR